MDRILAIDVGAGTQDVLVYERDLTAENWPKMVLPSRTRIVAARIRVATTAGRPVHLAGTLMGGGASADAVKEHLAAGLPVTATADAARTIHNDLDRVASLGVTIRDEPRADAVVVIMGDVDLNSIRRTLAEYAVEMPDTIAIAVQDHGYSPGVGNNDLRFAYLDSLIREGGDLARMVFHDPPQVMTRMQAVSRLVPGAVLMDTGAAAVLGVLGDPVVGRKARDEGAILVNVGNMHTFAVLVKGHRLFGLFEHHTGGMTATLISDLVARLREGSISNESFRREFDGHGAALNPAYRDEGPFDFVAVTGPNRGIARELGYYEAVPHGDMMLSGAFGLVEGALLLHSLPDAAGTLTRT
jgi:uncharacterized protein (DUF1786 family)